MVSRDVQGCLRGYPWTLDTPRGPALPAAPQTRQEGALAPALLGQSLNLGKPKTPFRNVRWWRRKLKGRPHPQRGLPAAGHFGGRTAQRQRRGPRAVGIEAPRVAQARPGSEAPRPAQPPADPRAPPAAASTARRWARGGGARKVTAVAFLSALFT
ncbi:uncharacterized protein LOC115895521 isoform X4 [Rhinopithecus roxellana]|uniref:uncharacterized protein LOC115895521 isoform X4 n=1 Tax=Rhinopithecus roxellana TaxID=61622 RepID=UPI0012373D80|nr:uncharacterized protein LOC115895521 isoform X4 [Rhinopithecus roxellana]